MAMVLSAFLPNIIVLLRILLEDSVAKLLRITSETKKLLMKLERTVDVLEDAEKKKVQDRAVEKWLKDLREVVYEADNIINRCKIQAQRQRSREQQARPHLPLAICFRREDLHSEIASSIKSLNRKMDVILKGKSRLQLTPVAATNDRKVRPSLKEYQVFESDIVGTDIENDTSSLVKSLIEEEGEHHLLFAIVGMGGIGKTTLAKRIYDDERTRGTFDIRLWAFVSKDFTDSGLLLDIMDFADENSGVSQTKAQLEANLAAVVAKKRFLLVLDDVWDARIWKELLQTPLQDGACGSRVLVTTRDENVASQMGIVQLHHIKPLTIEDSWLLLCQSVPLDEDKVDVLRDIGIKIVEKCNGLPMSIKTIAGVLRVKEPSRDEWESVCESEAWSLRGLPGKDVNGALYLSYDDLPPNMKQCFLYCSLFPADFAIEQHSIIQQWISEGFIAIKDNSTLEEVAEEYYRELVARGLLQPESRYNMTRCKLHNTLRSLAQFLSQDENYTGNVDNLSDLAFVPRRVSVASKRVLTIPDEIRKQKSLRTLLLFKNPMRGDGLNDIFVRLRHLRVLDLSETAIDNIPETLRNLVHLRYLNLSLTRIRELPESIQDLCNLQFLVLQDCRWLHALPKGLKQLKSLKSLDLKGTAIVHVPFGIGKLEQLTSLQGFAVNDSATCEQEHNGWPLEELKHLPELRILHILKLEMALDQLKAKEAALNVKPHLKELELSYSNADQSSESLATVQRIEEILEEFCPPPCLESLKIVNYIGSEYPSWISVASLPNILQLDLIGCRLCRRLPPLGQLPQLRFLTIKDLFALNAIGPEQIGDNQQIAFPKLERLHIQNMHSLEIWTGFHAGALPSLQAIQLESCPKLKSLPEGLGYATMLTQLWILDAENLEAVENLFVLKELGVWNTPKLEKISNLPSLEDLSISYCPALESVESVDSLRHIQICDHNLQAIPKWIGLHALRLQFLDLVSSLKLLKRCLVDGSDWSLINDIAHVYGYSNSCAYFSYKKSPFRFDTNISSAVEEENSCSVVIEEEAGNSSPRGSINTVDINITEDVSVATTADTSAPSHHHQENKSAEKISSVTAADIDASDSSISNNHETIRIVENVSLSVAVAIDNNGTSSSNSSNNAKNVSDAITVSKDTGDSCTPENVPVVETDADNTDTQLSNSTCRTNQVDKNAVEAATDIGANRGTPAFSPSRLIQDEIPTFVMQENISFIATDADINAFSIPRLIHHEAPTTIENISDAVTVDTDSICASVSISTYHQDQTEITTEKASNATAINSNISGSSSSSNSIDHVNPNLSDTDAEKDSGVVAADPERSLIYYESLSIVGNVPVVVTANTDTSDASSSDSSSCSRQKPSITEKVPADVEIDANATGSTAAAAADTDTICIASWSSTGNHFQTLNMIQNRSFATETSNGSLSNLAHRHPQTPNIVENISTIMSKIDRINMYIARPKLKEKLKKHLLIVLLCVTQLFLILWLLLLLMGKGNVKFIYA
ncbi:putative disease resistance protein RGA3 [Typha angustifolia]|uniref:putative disease resistance protein RGA3 n=1 Tax=Typha angustifolia TaxID=59011 RepID=UPI003C2C9BE5